MTADRERSRAAYIEALRLASIDVSERYHNVHPGIMQERAAYDIERTREHYARLINEEA